MGFLAMVVPSVRAFTMPRFGWIGLILCMNPLIFLLPWLWNPTRLGLVSAASMVVLLGVINGIQLLFTGTVASVTNEFSDRLHSSWLWSVLPFMVAGVYLYGYAVRMPATQLDAIKNKQTLAPKSRSDTNEESRPQV
jgi:hypothetical protein